MDSAPTFIGFGEAAMAFASTGRGYDIKLGAPATRDAKLADFAGTGIAACDSAAEALAGAHTILSLVTADQALAAAEAGAPLIEPGALWLDMNSAAPQTKRAAATLIEPRGRYVDVAVMAPVHPARLGVPLLISGPSAEAGTTALRALGFTDVTIVGDTVGAASAIKMIRSVMIKGLEALSAECLLAAEAAGVRDAVIASLDASWPGADWTGRFDYNLDRMMQHGVRRAAELDEVAATLDALGTGSAMARAAALRQSQIGSLHAAPPAGLDAKLALLSPSTMERAA